MRFIDAREEYYGASGTVSSITRQLNLAGIAVIWVIKSDAKMDQLVSGLWMPLGLFCLSLILDLLQYVFQAVLWGKVTNEAGDVPPDQIETYPVSPPKWINYPGDFFWWAKWIVTIGAYLVLGGYFVEKFLSGN